ncbi:MAG: site-specific DNA-methyltransferase [Halobacteriaceae archaeon]
MKTEHRVVIGDARSLEHIDSNSVELIVTSPPYPMIEMWDDLFINLNSEIENAIVQQRGSTAFEQMHTELDKVWKELNRVLKPGGIACINIGDATRKLGENFRVYQNHARVITAFVEEGFQPLPEILWRKPVNSATKFMGSGMLPPNAYATLEHEYILIFRNGKTPREFEANSERRYESAYFWEERNQWFSDIWTEITGELQSLEPSELRDRSAAFPFEVPYRLINMYSIYGDTVLDPFWGTGTTSMAAMVAGRNSIGYELQDKFADVFENNLSEIQELSEKVIRQRLQNHEEYVNRRQEGDNELKYKATNYSFPVTTRQERNIQFYTISEIHDKTHPYQVIYQPFEN